MPQPLSGLSLLEAASADVAPGLNAAIGLCGRLAADLGATVTRVVRTDGPVPDQPFLQRGKRCLRIPTGGDGLLRDLAAKSDILVSDGRLPADGIRAAKVCAILSMDGNAAGDSTQSEFTIEARGGLLHVVGDPDRSPLRLGGYQTAYAAGLSAFTGLMAALCQPALPDGPRHVRVNLLDVAIWLNWKGLAVAEQTGKSPKRAGPLGEWPVLPCADGHVVAVHRVQEWARLQDLLDDPVLREERFQTIAGRRLHRADLNAALARFFAPLTRAEIHALSLKQKFPFGPVRSPAELRSDPQMLARGVFADGFPRVPVAWREGPA